MAIQDYKNIDEIKIATPESGIKAETITYSDRNLLKISDIPVNITDLSDYVLEMHVYSENLQSIFNIHDVKKFIQSKSAGNIQYSFNDFVIATSTNDTTEVTFYFKKFFNTFYPSFTANVKIVINFLKPVISSYEVNTLSVEEISPSRNETRIVYVDADTQFSFSKEFEALTTTDISIGKNYFVNFGNNNLSNVLNILVESDTSIITRFYEPVTNSVIEKQFCYLCEKIVNSYVFTETVIGISGVETSLETDLRPNFNININQEPREQTFNYRSFNDLVGTSSTWIVPILSSSNEQLNVDYSIFDTFVFYSSAVERLQNFKYKIAKIESYDSDIVAYSSSISTLIGLGSSSYNASQSMIKVATLKDQVFQTFTPYERYMYFESSSYYTGSLGEKFDSAWPKTTSTKPFLLYSVTSSQVTTWFSGQLATASLYDERNVNTLIKTIPLYIQQDDKNSDYVKFVNMVAEYFDELRLYISHIVKKDVYALKQNEGVSNKIAEKIVKQLGLELFTDMDTAELDNYLVSLTNDSSLNSVSTNTKKNTFYKKLLNNLVYLLKTKGTVQNIHALANLFGIDRDYYEIREYGGPTFKSNGYNSQSIFSPSLEYVNLEYSLGFSGSQSVRIDWKDYNSKKPDSIIYKFKLTNSVPTTQTLFESKNKFAVIAEKTNTTSVSGVVKFLLTGSNGVLSASTSDIPVFNGNFWNVMLQRSVSTSSTEIPEIYTLKVNNVSFDRINFYVSASLFITGSLTSSYNSSYTASNDFYIGGATGSSFVSSQLVGYVSDIKFYTEIIHDDIFQMHSLAQTIITANESTSSFETMVTQLTFNENKNLASTSSVYDSNLSSFGKNHGTASGFTTNTYQVRYEKNIVKPKTVLLNKQTSEKVRIESNYATSLDGYIYLNSGSSVETSSFDKHGLDSKKLDFIFSPSNIENKNIITSINPDINDFIGDPIYMWEDSDSYRELDTIKRLFRKYKPPVDLQDYIFNSYKLSKNLFKNIKQFAPERTDFNFGVSIEPTILERTNVQLYKKTDVSKPTYFGIIPDSATTIDSSYLYRSGAISTDKVSSIAAYGFKGTGTALNHSDRIFVQGIKLRNILESFVTSSSGPSFYTIHKTGKYEFATMSIIEPISNFKYTPTYDSASGAFYYKRNSAMEPNSDGTYSSNHIKFYRYRTRSIFAGAQNYGPDGPSGSTTFDGGKVIEITFISPNRTEVSTQDLEKPRLRVEGVDLNI